MIGLVIRQVAAAIALTFHGKGAPLAYALLLSLGTLATAFYLVMLPRLLSAASRSSRYTT